MTGAIVQTVSHPEWESVDEYRQYLKRQSPSVNIKRDLIDPDIECVCCSQPAPHVAAALVKVENRTPYTKQFNDPKGTQMWLCADCYNSGVRPKYIYFKDVRWNKQGRRIKKRAEKHPGHPW